MFTSCSKSRAIKTQYTKKITTVGVRGQFYKIKRIYNVIKHNFAITQKKQEQGARKCIFLPADFC